MTHLLAYEPPPFFPTGIDFHTTGGVALLWDTARILDMASVAPRDLFQGHSEHRHEFVNENPLSYWRGGFRYRTGLTTLAFYTDTTSMGVAVTPRFRAYVNGVLRIDQAITSGVQLHTSATMASWGLADGEVAEVDCYIEDPALAQPDLPPGSAWGTHYLVDGFVGPASAALDETWPGVPTFTTGPDEAKAIQLGNAALWLARRMNTVPMPLFQRVISAPDLPWWNIEPGESPMTRHLWSGGGPRGPFDRLRVRVVWVPSRTATTQRISLRINGVEVATTAAWTTSWGLHDFNVDLSGYGANTLLRIELFFEVTGPDVIEANARMSVEWAEFHRAAPPLQTMTAKPTPLESTDWATRKARLNAISGWLQVIYDRIAADVDRWDRIRLFRSSYSYDRIEAPYLVGRYHAVRRYRGGLRLIVRGSNIKLGWGAFGYKLNDPKEEFGEYSWTWQSEETLVSGDSVATKEIYLDALTGLPPGFQYTIYGPDCRYAAEELL